MTKLTLYHGSSDVIKTPVFGKGNVHNDYGLGFYCTKSLEMAYEWAVGRGTDGYANIYELESSGLLTFDFSDTDYCELHWLATLLQNRVFDIRSPLALEAYQYLIEYFSVDLSKVDLVIGHRADDSYFTFAQDFIMGVISYRQLQNAMRLGDLGQQIMVKSERGFERLKFIDAKEAPKDVWLAQREERDRFARRRYFDVERSKRRRDDLFITQIMDEELRPDNESL